MNNKKIEHSVSVTQPTYSDRLDQDEYLESDLKHVYQSLDLFSEEQGIYFDRQQPIIEIE